MKKQWFTLERFLSLIVFLYLAIILIVTNSLPLKNNSEIPYLGFVIQICHIVFLILAVINFIHPIKLIPILCFVLESFIAIISGLEYLAVFMFHSALILVYLDDLFEHKLNKKIIFMIIIHLCSMALLYPQGWIKILITLSYSIFTFLFYLIVFNIIRQKVLKFYPSVVTENTIIKEIKVGKTINLSKYSLTNRQIDFILENIKNNLNYREISAKYKVSVSTVKKEFVEIFKIFNITKLEELRMLLMQFDIQR